MKKILSLVLSLILITPCFVFPVNVLAANPTLTVDMNDKTGKMRHGSAGFLYGLGSEGTPSPQLITPLKPGTAVQKAPDGLQHPTGDVLDVAKTFISAGGEQVQIYLQDIYALWSYEYTGMDDYLSKIEEMVPKIVALRESDPSFDGKFVYIPFNEPDGIWYGNIDSQSSVQNSFNQNWKAAFDLIRSLDPKALIGGVSYATYRPNAMRSWLKFSVENNCEPDYITWHELQTDKLSSFKSHLDHYRSLEKELGMTEREIIINEYAPQDHCSVPGKMVNWIALFEENKVSGCLPYWHNAGNLNDIAADNNEPNGAWWLYKWYGDMSGETLKLSTSTSRSELYGLASIDDNKKLSNIIFGGVDGTVDIVLNNIDDTIPFNNSAAVNVKVEATYWSAFHGISHEPDIILQGTYPAADGKVTISVDTEASAAYNITVTQAPEGSNTGVVYKGAFRATYEAEDASLSGNVYLNSTPWTYAYSNGARLSGIQSPADGYDLSFTLPCDGFYKMDIVYGNGYGLNTADPSKNDPKTLTQTINFDKTDKKIIHLENTLRDQMQGMYTDYVYLTEGDHILSVRGSDENMGSFSNDCISFTYCGPQAPVFNTVYEAEFGDFNMLLNNSDTTLTTENTIPGYSASGYVTGLSDRTVPQGGGLRFTVVVPDNGLYDISLRYNAQQNSEAYIYLNNTALDLNNLITVLPLPANTDFCDISQRLFLQKGINIIDIHSSLPIALDCLKVTKSNLNEEITIEAEDCALTGTASVTESDYACGGRYVSNIRGGTDDALVLNVEAAQSGRYNMIIYYSVSELFGAHSYNAQIVDRYASFSVNGNDSERLYFKNSYSNENWRSAVLPVYLEKGQNTVKIFNDNWRILKCGVLKEGASEHLPENIDYQHLVNYAPNFDKFVFMPAVADDGDISAQCKMSIFVTDGGKALLDKSYAEIGEDVHLSFVPEYSEGRIEVLANGEDISHLAHGNMLTYPVTSDTEFKVRFILPENLDSYIVNSSFGTGDFYGWQFENALIQGDESHVAKIGAISQHIDIPDGWYTISFIAKGNNLKVNAGFKEETLTLNESFTKYFVRAKSQGGIMLTLYGDAYVDDFTLMDNIDSSLLYFVDAGDSNPATLSEGDRFGVNNSVTEQFFAPDPITGKEWGILDTYTPSSKFPSMLTGAETWPYEYDTTDGRDKITSYRYAKDQDDRTGNGISYKFSLPDGNYAFEVGFNAPSDWMASVNRKATLKVNDTILAYGVIPKTDPGNPIIVKNTAYVEGGYATLNLKLDSDGAGGPLLNYIKISYADEIGEYVKVDTSNMSVTGSATWNNDPSTAAEYAFDSDTNTFFDGVSGGQLIIDMGCELDVSAIGYYPRKNWANRMTATGFYGSLNGSDWELIFTIPSSPAENEECVITSDRFISGSKYRYIKYQNPYDYCNVAEINIYKSPMAYVISNLTDEFNLKSISLEGDNYILDYVGEGVFIQADNANNLYKITPLNNVTTIPLISKTEKIFIWDIEKLKPLSIISK